MLSLLTRPLSAITREDIEALMDVSESQYLDFKEAPRAKGGTKRSGASATEETWLSDHAKKELAKDVVAFANADSGILVLGIEETRDLPSRARGITPIPRCHEVAKRLERSVGDRIEPPIIGLEARGVETQDDGGGVVIIRVPASMAGPHAVKLEEKPGLAVYIRRNDTARAATMRDIHDMVIDTAQSWQRAERSLEERRSAAYLRISERTDAAVGYRVTVIPGRARYELRNIYPHYNEIFESWRGRKALDISGDWGTTPQYIIIPGDHAQIRSALRGVSAECFDDYGYRKEQLCFYMSESGMTEIISISKRQSQDELYIDGPEILACALGAFEAADRLRSQAGAAGAELLIDIELIAKSSTKVGLKLFKTSKPQVFGDCDSGRIDIPLRLPTYRIGPREALSELATEILRDLYNAAGLVCPVRTISVKT